MPVPEHRGEAAQAALDLLIAMALRDSRADSAVKFVATA
jgi:hypothetical protein